MSTQDAPSRTAPPTLWRTMVQPKWIVALLVALGIAAGFAALGQWQLGRALDSAQVVEYPTETIRPLAGVATPGEYLHESTIGQMVSVSGRFVPTDYDIVAGRVDRGQDGYWVIGRFAVSDDDSSGEGEPAAEGPALAVACGWAPDRSTAERVRDRLRAAPASTTDLVGRLLPSEGPVVPAPGTDPHEIRQMSVAYLVNLWHHADGLDVYTGYVVDRSAPQGLRAIFSPPPAQQAEINWLNIFYALEWAVFAGFAVYLWFRIVKDAWEREAEDRLEAEAQERPIE